VFSKFWRAYAGDLPIEDIDDKVMREYVSWRRDYYANFKVLPTPNNGLVKAPAQRPRSADFVAKVGC
jgi:hypothetical protein